MVVFGAASSFLSSLLLLSTDMRGVNLSDFEQYGWVKVVRIGQQIRNVNKLMECITYTAEEPFQSGRNSKGRKKHQARVFTYVGTMFSLFSFPALRLPGQVQVLVLVCLHPRQPSGHSGTTSLFQFTIYIPVIPGTSLPQFLPAIKIGHQRLLQLKSKLLYLSSAQNFCTLIRAYLNCLCKG